APAPSDILVTKRRVSAFSGSDLDVVLRAANIDTLVLTGIATSGVVLSTLRQAADLDYRLVVLADACLDGDADVHRVLTEKAYLIIDVDGLANVLYAVILKKPGFSLIVLKTVDFFSSAMMTMQASRADFDQPFVRANEVANSDSVYVGLNYFFSFNDPATT